MTFSFKIPSYSQCATPSDFFSWVYCQKLTFNQISSGLNDSEPVPNEVEYGRSEHALQQAMKHFENELYAKTLSPEEVQAHIDLKQVYYGLVKDRYCYKYYLTGPLQQAVKTWLHFCRYKYNLRHPSYNQECLNMVMLPSQVPGLQDLPQPGTIQGYLPYMRQIESQQMNLSQQS